MSQIPTATMLEGEIISREWECHGTTWTNNEQFDRDGYIVIENIWDPKELYSELGTDRVLCYARFGGDNKDFPVDTQFAQVTLVKNPTSIGTTSVYFNDSYSSMSAIKFPSTTTQNPTVGKVVQQPVTGGTAYGYVASWDKETKVLKYIHSVSSILRCMLLASLRPPVLVYHFFLSFYLLYNPGL